MKTADKASISIIEAKATKVGLNETESDKANTRVIRKKLYELVRFSRSYDVHTFYFDLPRFSRQDWSVAPSIFNIKEQGLAHCLH